MGHKVNPVCLRIGVNKVWASRWFAPSKRQFAAYLHEDRQVRELLKRELDAAAVGRVDIERSPEYIRIIIHTARPGVLIGRRGENIQRLQEQVQRIVGTQKQLKMDYIEITNPYIEASLIGQSIAFQLEKRIAFRRAMKRAIQQAMEGGAKGVKILCAGRLGGGEMKRREKYRDGKVPLGTLRSDIDFGEATAHTTTGCIGVKVWIYKGDVIRLKPEEKSRSVEGGRPMARSEGSQLAAVEQPSR
ncbi:MAG: 30S ribosomal protein S3 [Candidatus Omnitrophica bacterium]|nr:30S ribosomal protein S3 [Candidatus Omnitrophota bacterium]